MPKGQGRDLNIFEGGLNVTVIVGQGDRFLVPENVFPVKLIQYMQWMYCVRMYSEDLDCISHVSGPVSCILCLDNNDRMRFVGHPRFYYDIW